MNKIIYILLLISLNVFAKNKAANDTIISDHWYKMKVGQTPWGFFHEVIIEKEGKYYYRYDMTKVENGKTYQENLGAIATTSLIPVAFNLNKLGSDLQESYDGHYEANGDTGLFNVTLKGTRFKNSKRHVNKSTILEAFFPVWVMKNWGQIKNGFKASLPIFTEDPDAGEYAVKQAHINYRGDKTIRGAHCKELEIEFDGRRSNWCIDNATLIEMIVPAVNINISIATSEQDAKTGFRFEK